GKGASSAVEIATNAANKAAGNSSGSMTGNTLFDKLFETMLARLLTPQPALDPVATLKNAVELMKTLNPERPQRDDEDPIDALGRVKEKLGLDLVDLLRKKNSAPAEVNPWVGFFTTL